MPVVAIRRNAWQQGTDSQKVVMRLANERVQLGIPAVYSDGTDEWFVFHDQGITLKDVAILGTVVAGLMDNRDYVVPMRDGGIDKPKVREQLRDYVKDTIVDPVDVPLTELVDRQVPERVWQDVPVLDENGDPVLDENGDPVTRRVLVETGRTVTIQVEEPLGDPSALVLAAQGAPGFIRTASSVPETWIAVEDSNLTGGEVGPLSIARRG